MVVRHAPWLALTGDWAYDVAIWLSVHINRARRRLGLPYWSFSAWSKQKVKRAVNFISAFQDAVVADAVRHGVSAVLCGHIHQPAMQNLNGIEYINTGDWVESCTAVVEDHDGRLELVRWTTPAEVEASVRVVLHTPVKHKAAEAA
jgi:UDP-2,3-diacylglucosamine pyrophosphatase LpxH